MVIVLFAGTLAMQGEANIEQTDESIRLVQDDKVIWQFNHFAEKGKPYFHPLATTTGHNLTDLAPEDHPWHRGLWFSWKFLNQVNYWEENRETGLSEGLTKLGTVVRSIAPDQTVTINLTLTYASGRDPGHDIITEKRTIVITPPNNQGVYAIDWSSDFAPTHVEVELDRTPLASEGGETWGGYAGYSMRMNQTTKGGLFRNSEGLTGMAADRQPARWMSFELPEGGGALFMDHPHNLNSPAKWYLNDNMPYFSPAVIHDAPYTVAVGDVLSLRYRILVFPASLSPSEADAAWRDWER